MNDSYPKRKQKEFVDIQKRIVKENTDTIINEVNKLLNSKQFSKYLPGKNKSLKQLGWGFNFIEPEHALYLEKFRYLDDTVGWAAPDGYNLVFDNSHKHWLGINRVFQGDLGTHGERGSFYDVLKHEIAHCIDYYLRGKDAILNEDTMHDDAFHNLNKELWGNASIGDKKTKTDVDIINKFAIVFEPSIGCDEGAIKLVHSIPRDYYSLKYIYSSIVRLVNGKVVREWFPNQKQLKQIKQDYSISEIRAAKREGVQQLNESFEEMFDIVNEGKLGDIFKTGIAAAGIFGSTLGGADLYAKQTTNPTPQVQTVSNAPIAKNKYVVGKNGSERWVLAATLYAETRGESLEGKKAVASVIYNRAAKRNKSLKDICLQRLQFSCWNGKNRMNVIINNSKDRQSWIDCWNIANQMVNGKFKPITKADHYYNPDKANPSWGKYLVNRKQIGHHLFGIISKK